MKHKLPFLVPTALGGALLLLAANARAQPGAAFIVYPNFENALTNSADNSPGQNSLALFSGSVGAYRPPGSADPASVPVSAEGIRLAGSDFGQMLARQVPHPHFEVTNIALAQAVLYPPATATTRASIAGSATAFRYKHLLYSGSGPTDIRAGFEGITNYFGNPERQQVAEGIKILRRALKYSPLNRKLRGALLDAYYDWIVAEAQFVKTDLANVAKYRLGLVLPNPGEFIIDYEIAGYTNILHKYGAILEAYGGLLLDQGGVAVSQIDPTAPSGITLGQWIFQQEQPLRNQMAAQFRDANGILTTVPVNGSTGPVQLFAGSKDYVALLGLMRDYAESAAELARLYGMRGRNAVQPGEKGDRTLAFELIEGINRELLLNSSLLNALLPDAIPPESESDASGVRAALAGVLTGTAELTRAGSFLNSQVNVLGYDPDFLVLISTFVDQTQAHLWDSYDALRGWLGSPADPASILGRATEAFETAQDNYDDYRGSADQVFNEMDANDDAYRDRYREITGYFPADPPDPYSTSAPAHFFPPINTNNLPSHVNNPRVGSELRKAYLSIQQSNFRNFQLGQSWKLLTNQTQQVHQRLNDAQARVNSIYWATKEFKDVITEERDTITSWNAAQAGMQAGYDMAADLGNMAVSASGIEKWNPISVGVVATAGATVAVLGAVNIAVQTGGEVAKGNAERNIALANADFQRNLAMAETGEGISAAAEEQRNLDRERQSWVLTTTDNVFVRNQEIERARGLLGELHQLRVRRNQENREVAGRYYADPIHYLRSQNSMIRADFAFRSAQRWVFFLLRALEYKYNQPFVYTGSGPGSPRWDLGSVFRIRNAEELGDLLDAMEQFNLANLGKLNGRTLTTDKISLKDDVWGRTIPDAPERAAEFQRRIAESYDAPRGVYEIKLNTLRLSKELENGSLFLGAEYGNDGSLITQGNYLDKIDYLKIKFVDTGKPSPSTSPANLSFGGTCFTRSETPAPTGGGLESDPGELQSFPFRYFAMGTDTNGVLTANSFAEQSANVEVVFWNQPNKDSEPTDPLNPGAYQSTFLRERPVATTELVLTIAANRVNTANLQDIHFYIRHRYALRSQPQL